MLGPTLSTTLFALALLFVSSLALLLPSIPALLDTSTSPSSLSAPLSILHLNASGLNTAYNSTNTKAVGIHGDPTCSAVEYGDNLNVQGCREAVRKMKHYRNQIQFGNRGSGSIVQTPRRFASPDGICAITIFPKSGEESDTSSWFDIKEAAGLTVNYCLPNSGGFAYVGEHGMLAVTIEKYIPHVGCGGLRRDFTSISQALINSIPTDMEYMKFGEEGSEAQIQVRLPQTFHPTPRVSDVWDYTAIVELEDHGEPLFARWYDVWAGLVALESICVANGFVGSSISQGRVKVTLEVKSTRTRMANLTAAPQAGIESS